MNRELQTNPQKNQGEGKNQKHQSQVLIQKLQEKILDMTMKVSWMEKKWVAILLYLCYEQVHVQIL